MTTRRTQVGLHLDAEMIEDLREMSTKTGVPMSTIMRRAISQALAVYNDKGTVPPLAPLVRRKAKA